MHLGEDKYCDGCGDLMKKWEVTKNGSMYCTECIHEGRDLDDEDDEANDNEEEQAS